MTNRFDAPKAPLRAEPRTVAANVQSVPATPGGLIRSTLLAAGAAGAILVLFWLPAEYGIDPTGVGALTGLTEMGEIKQQLAVEAEADALAASAGAPTVTSSAVVPDEVLQRLDRIDAQLAALVAVVGAPAGAVEPNTAPEQAVEAVAEPLPNTEPAAPDPVKTAVSKAADANPDWRDEVSYTLNPGEGIEVKLAMEEGQTARFAWTANGGAVNFDMHGDGGGQKISYEQGRTVPEMSGELVAAFTGNHGWFWRNRTEAPVTVTLRTGGEYLEIKAP